MANPTTKFVSVNLNKSYGHHSHQPQSQQHGRPSSSSSYSSGGHFGNGVRGRASGGGAGMVVLSRNRSSINTAQKGGQRLSVPPPMNLPSLRKEHERFDPLSATGSSAGAGSSGLGSGNGASAMGWSKPGAFAEKDGGQDQMGLPRISGDHRVGSPTRPLSAGFSSRSLLAAEKAVVLKGEDFPSLHAAFTSPHKQKDAATASGQKQKPVLDDSSTEPFDKFDLITSIPMRPQLRSTRSTAPDHLSGDVGSGHQLEGSEQSRKLDCFLPGPLPVVRLRHTFDWADDERDTSNRFPRTEPSRSQTDYTDGRHIRDSEVGGISTSDILKTGSFGRDKLNSARDASSWRTPPQSRDGLGSRDHRTDRDGPSASPSSFIKNNDRENNRRGQPIYTTGALDGSNNISQDLQHPRKDFGYVQNTHNNKNREPYTGRSFDQNWRDRNVDISVNRYKRDVSQNNVLSKLPVSSESKVSHLVDPILNFGRDRRSSNLVSFSDDSAFDDRDPFSDLNVKIFKRKKDVLKQADFHDPVRESFEAELERVQRIQEEERRRVFEEQTRALTLARKEEEEREKFVKEEEERRRRLEEEAREAAWRAEQERVNAAKKAEEQRLAREEEKRKLAEEEERRKEAARIKLLELEAKIAKRQAEAAMKDSSSSILADENQVAEAVKEGDALRGGDVGEWEDGEQPLPRMTILASSNSISTNRFFEPGSRLSSSRDVSSSFSGKSKQLNSWKNGTYDNSHTSTAFNDRENGYHNHRQAATSAGRVFTRKGFYGGPAIGSGRPSSKDGVAEPLLTLNEPHHSRGNRWSVEEDNDQYLKLAVHSDLIDNDKFSDAAWEQSHPLGSPHPQRADSLYQNMEVERFSNLGRSRHLVRQPRVLPPPSFPSINRSSFSAASEYLSSSSHPDDQNQMTGKISEFTENSHDSGYWSEKQPGMTSTSAENTTLPDLNEENTHGCDSQSSVSVSSPPGSPTHLSNDDLDDSGDMAGLIVSAHDKLNILSDCGHNLPTSDDGNINTIVTSGSLSQREEDEWIIENNEDLQEQQEYDEENSYEGEVDIHEGDGENLDVAQNFDDLHPDVDVQNNLRPASGFNERMEVITTCTDESGKTSLRDELNVEAQKSTSDTLGEHGSFDELLNSNELSPQKECLEGSEDTSKITNDMEKTLQNMVLEPVGAAGDPPKDLKSSPSEVSAQQITISDSDIPMPLPLLGHSSSSSTFAVSNQTEPPLNLQFGLFSGPPLIPSPVPAIQIGSFQMPLHPHPPVRPSVPHVHSSPHSLHSPFFPIGQLRYASPMSQGILSLNPQHMPFARPSAPTHYSFNHKPSNTLYNCAVSDPFIQNVQTNNMGSSLSVGNQLKMGEKAFDMLQKKVDLIKLNTFPDNKKIGAPCHNEESHPLYGKNEISSKSGSSMEIQGGHDGIFRNHSKLAGDNNRQKIVSNPEAISSRFSSREKFVRRHVGSSGGRGKNYVYTIKNTGTGSKSSFPGSEPSCESNAFQRSHQRNTRRAEFRVRQNDKRKLDESSSLSSTAQFDKQLPNGRTLGISSRNGYKKEAVTNKSLKANRESSCLIKGVMSSETDCSQHKNAGKEEPNRFVSSPCNSHPQEDIDAPLQNGVVRIFNQPGIETLSDEDDFIEVRSKRQMLYDRREQREKEIKAKSRALKANRKARSLGQNSVAFSYSNKITSSPQGNGSKRNPSSSMAHEFSSAFTSNMVSHPLLPIGAPPVNVSADVMPPPMKSAHKLSGSAISDDGLILEENNISSGSWSNGRSNQQVMSLTQTQLDEAMKPVCFDAHKVSISNQTNVTLEREEKSTSIILPGKTLSDSKPPLKSLVVGEKIQFGAVTAPIFLPPVCRAFPSRIGPSLSSRRNDVSGERLRSSENGHSLLFEKEKHHEESDAHIEDAEAEAAASAVAVAAISSDEVGNDGLGSASNCQRFEGADDVNVLTSEVANNIREVTGQSAEESLTVTLPADLSVETPLSVWPVLPNPHNSSSPIISHFPGAPPSHFPCFEMNPMLGGHIFAFGPHDELVGTQSQPQRSTTLGQGPIGTWSQSHSGVDSMYGPSAGFTGPFISPPGGIPGIQGQPHMVFYNHFPPLAQFGLSYMGPTTYVPSGKQPDWNHSPVSTSVNVSEGDLSNMNADSNHHVTHNMPSSIRNLGSGSSVVPLGSPLPMFDPSSFQASLDIPMQHRWPLPPPLHNISLSLLQHHAVDVANTSHASRSISADLSRGNNRPSESQPSVHSDGKSTFPVNSNAQLSDEQNLVNIRNGNTVSDDSIQTSRPFYNYSSVNFNSGLNVSKSLSKNSDISGCDNVYKMTGSVNDRQNTGSSARSHVGSSSSSVQYINPVGPAAKRVLASSSQKIVSTNEMHRRMGYQGRNRISTAEKNFGSVKMKQIYVAKSTGAEPAASI